MKLMAFPSLIAGIWITINSSNPVYALNNNQNIKYLLGNNQLKLLNSDSGYLAQSDGLYGCWALTHSAAGTIYESLLRMDGYDGLMVTGFFNSAVGDTVYVKQSMKLRNSAQGLVIDGSNPVNAQTGASIPTYSPDNFLYQVRPNGDQLFGTCDDQGQCSSVEVGSCPSSSLN